MRRCRINGRGELKSNKKCNEGNRKAGDGTDECYIEEVGVSFGRCFDAILKAQIRETQRWQDCRCRQFHLEGKHVQTYEMKHRRSKAKQKT